MSTDDVRAIRDLIFLEMLQVGREAWGEARKDGEPILVELFIPKGVKKFFDEGLPLLVPDKQAEFETAIFMELIHNGLMRISTKMQENKEDVVSNLMRVAEGMHDRRNPL